jgi:hypothetical protein
MVVGLEREEGGRAIGRPDVVPPEHAASLELPLGLAELGKLDA